MCHMGEHYKHNAKLKKIICDGIYIIEFNSCELRKVDKSIGIKQSISGS